MKKLLWFVRWLVYVVAGVLMIVYSDGIVHYVPYVVGAIMLVYAAEGIFDSVHDHKSLEDARFFDNIILVLLSLIMIIVGNANYSTSCIIWAVWSILREGLELEEIYKFRKIHLTALISSVESVIVIIMSVLLILHPEETHALMHVILLGVELILHTTIPTVNHYIQAKMNSSGEQKKTQ